MTKIQTPQGNQNQTNLTAAFPAASDSTSISGMDADQPITEDSTEQDSYDWVDAINTRLSNDYAGVLADFRAGGLVEILAMETARPSGSPRPDVKNGANLALVFYVNSEQPAPYHAVYKGPHYPWAMCQLMDSVTSMQDFERVFASILGRLPQIRHSLLQLHEILGGIKDYGVARAVAALMESAGGWLVDSNGMGFIPGEQVRSNYVRLWDHWAVPIYISTEKYLARWCDSVVKVKTKCTPKPHGEFLECLEFNEDGTWLSKWADETIQGTWTYNVLDDKPQVVLSHRLEFGLPSLDLAVSRRLPPVVSWRVNNQLFIDGVTLLGSDDALLVRLQMGVSPHAFVETMGTSAGTVETIDSEIFA